MKNKIIYCFAISICIVAGYFLLSHKEEVKPVVVAEPVEETSCIVDGYGKGSSMVEYGIPNEANSFWINTCNPCVREDICAFRCTADKCKNSHEGTEVSKYTKKVIKIENGCYWFEGNKDAWYENGKRYSSFDSREYGFLCPGEFEMDGPVSYIR